MGPVTLDMNRKCRFFAAVLAGGLLSIVPAGVSAAATNDDSSDGDTVVVSGIEYGPEDGLVVETGSVDLVTGQDPFEVVWGSSGRGGVTPNATWGSSYAKSTEYVQLYFEGKAKAAANVYNGTRIIEVCIWYSMGGDRITSKVCSEAYEVGKGLWGAGREETVSTWDSLNPWAPTMTFNYARTLINP